MIPRIPKDKLASKAPATVCKTPMRNIKNSYRPRVTARIEAYTGADLAEAATQFAGKARASNTGKAYAEGIAQYLAFCEEAGFAPLPGEAEAVRQFLTFLAIRRGLSIATIKLRFAALRHYYRDAVGRNNVTSLDSVLDCMKGLARELGERPVHAPSVGAEMLRQIIRALPRDAQKQLTTASLRDRALLLVTYAGALRRSEVAAILRADVVFEEAGARMLLRGSKTDQNHEGHWIGLGFGKRQYTCPVRALQAWFEVSPGCTHLFHPVSPKGTISADPLSDKGIGRIVKRCAAAARLDWEQITAHSLRAGITTDLTAAGVPTALVQERTRHKSANMVARYHRPDINRTNFTRKAGL